ncbi:Zinc transporter 9 domain protein [Aphelenchoides fujianensis]|nr:Zinc transporter 9 domain protein [Aphelenchoides fujianensis]
MLIFGQCTRRLCRTISIGGSHVSRCGGEEILDHLPNANEIPKSSRCPRVPKSRPPRASRRKGADRVVGIAFALNACDCLCKFGAAYLTGSKSLFAEAIHSTMDTVNQLILLLGIRYSARNPDPNYPYGYGNMRYVTSLISGCGILSFGCGLSMYHGISGLLHPSHLGTDELREQVFRCSFSYTASLFQAFYALGMSFVFQGCSGLTAYREVRKKAAEAKLKIHEYVTSVADPSLNVVLLEDSAAVTGVVIALGAVTLSSLLDSTIPDCVGSILIGVLLGTVASFIIRTNAAHLVGRSVPKRMTEDIVCILEKDGIIRSVHDVKATVLGVDKSRFKAELDFNGYRITKKYLHENCDVPQMFAEVKSMTDQREFERFMAYHGEKVIDKIGDEVDRIEEGIRKRYPNIKHVDLEAL